AGSSKQRPAASAPAAGTFWHGGFLLPVTRKLLSPTHWARGSHHDYAGARKKPRATSVNTRPGCHVECTNPTLFIPQAQLSVNKKKSKFQRSHGCTVQGCSPQYACD